MAARKISSAEKQATRTKMLNGIATAAFHFVGADTALIAAVRAAGKDWTKQKDVKDMFTRGYVAGRMFPGHVGEPTLAMLDGAAKVISAPGAGSTKPDRRTTEQERYYGGARVAWHALLKRAEVKTTESRGGANNTGKRSARTTKAGQEKAKQALANAGKPAEIVKGASATPKAAGPAEIVQFLQQQAAMLMAYTNKNAKHFGPELRKAVYDFHKAVKGAEVVEATKATT